MMFQDIYHYATATWEQKGPDGPFAQMVGRLAMKHFTHYPADQNELPDDWKQRLDL